MSKLELPEEVAKTRPLAPEPVERRFTPDFGKLAKELGRAEGPEAGPAAYAPRAERYAVAEYPKATPTPLQVIAKAIKHLVWDEAEALGKIVHDNMPKDEEQNLARALQKAADQILRPAGPGPEATE